MCFAYAYLMPLWALAYTCPALTSSCQAIRASFMIPCLGLSTCHMEVQQNTWVCPSNFSAVTWLQPLVALGTGHKKAPLHLCFLRLFLQSGCR